MDFPHVALYLINLGNMSEHVDVLPEWLKPKKTETLMSL